LGFLSKIFKDPYDAEAVERVLTRKGQIFVAVIWIGGFVVEAIRGENCNSGWVLVTAMGICMLIPPACFFIPRVSRLFIKSDATDEELNKLLTYGVMITLILFVLTGGFAEQLYKGKPIKGIAPDCQHERAAAASAESASE